MGGRLGEDSVEMYAVIGAAHAGSERREIAASAKKENRSMSRRVHGGTLIMLIHEVRKDSVKGLCIVAGRFTGKKN